MKLEQLLPPNNVRIHILKNCVVHQVKRDRKNQDTETEISLFHLCSLINQMSLYGFLLNMMLN